MRKISRSILALSLILFMVSATAKPKESNRLYEKIVYLELNLKEDSMLFRPLSKAWANKSWQIYADITVNGSDVINYEKYAFSFENRTENVWTLLHPLIIAGTIQSYYPDNPELYRFGPSDDGELSYPILVENETFLNSDKVRESLCHLLGSFDASSTYPLVDEYGENIIVTENGIPSFAYSPAEFIWHTDKDVVKYRLRVSVLVNNKGVEKKRVIKSMSPIINRYDDYGTPIDSELLWLNFEEIEPFLKNAYYFQEDWKPITFLDHILNKVKNTAAKDFYRASSHHVNPSQKE